MEGPYHALRVAKVVQETADARSLVLEVPEALRARFAYRAGQFLTLPRVRSPAGAWCAATRSRARRTSIRDWKVTVKRVAGGRVSNWMNDAVREGDVLEVMRPAGRFCLTERDADVVLFGGGSGITPVISLLKTALATTRAPRAPPLRQPRPRLDHLPRRARRRGCGATRAASRSCTASTSTKASPTRRRARPRRAAPSDADFYVCGPAPFMDVVERALLGLGVPRERILIERFEYAGDGTPRDVAAPAREAAGEARRCAP